MKNKILNSLFFLIFLITMNSCVKIPQIQHGGEVQQIFDSKVNMKDGGILNMKNKDSEETTTIILVRHAEKRKDQQNPDLTDVGNLRATKLKDILSTIPLDRIYSTDYNRTQQTAKPTSNTQKIDITSYDSRALNEFGNMLLQSKKGEKILVVGHSNTTNVLLNYFMKKTVVESISESDYENLYIVNINNQGNANSLLLKF